MDETTPPNPAPGTLLVHLGDPPSLAAAATVRDPATIVPWHPVTGSPAAEGRREAVRRTAAGLGTRRPLLDAAALPAGPAGRADEGLAEVALLARAAVVAVAHGCTAVLWTVQRGQLARDVMESVERAEALIDALAVGAAPAGVPAIELPVVDLDDDQVLDLVDTAGLPWEGAWPCDREDERPCGECRQCRRWARAARALGLDWPWDLAAASAAAGSGAGAGAEIEVVGRVRGGRSEPLVPPGAVIPATPGPGGPAAD